MARGVCICRVCCVLCVCRLVHAQMMQQDHREFERADAAREAANERQHHIALRRWRYPFGGLPQEPIDLPDDLAASEAAEPPGDDE